MSGLLTDDEIVDIQIEYFADEVEIIAGMKSWTREEVEKYFESGGTVKPMLAAKKYFTVVHKPRVAIREKPSATANIVASLNTGALLDGVLHADDANWLALSDGRGCVMITHASLGKLLEHRLVAGDV